jgi:hypothetical protein
MPRNAEWRFQQAWGDYQVRIPPFAIRRFKVIDDLEVNVACFACEVRALEMPIEDEVYNSFYVMYSVVY